MINFSTEPATESSGEVSLRIAILGADKDLGLLIYRALTRRGADSLLPVVEHRPRSSLGLEGWVLCDLQRPADLGVFLEDCDLLIHAAAPFRGAPQGIVDVAIQMGIHYLDLCDDWLYLQNVLGRDSRAKEAGVGILSGLATFPGLSAILAAELVREWSTVKSFRLFYSPGDVVLSSHAFMGALCEMVGAPVTRREWQNSIEVRGWDEPELVRFAEPVGVVTVRNGNVPDLDLFPLEFGCASAVFKIGVQSAALRCALSFSAGRAVLSGCSPVARALTPQRGSVRGALRIVAEGERGQQKVRACVDAVEKECSGGLAVGVILHAVERARQGRLPGGAVRLTEWASTPEATRFLESVGVEVVWTDE